MSENDTMNLGEFELDTLETVKKTSGKILAVDFGDVRTGLAVSDPSRLLASGIGYISPGGIDKTAEEVAKIALEQKRRGADVVKIVNFARTEDELMANLNTTYRLKKELNGTPFLYLANGAECRLLRQIGARLGVCMYLCVQNYIGVSSKEQPLLRSMKIARDNMME